MEFKLQDNVNLIVEPIKKYKTTQILVRFATSLKKGIASKRSLLASLLETNSKKYPVETEIAKKLAELYGASFSVYVSRKGGLHFLNFAMNLVNDHYLPKIQLLEEAGQFLKEIIFQPKIVDGAFEKDAFLLEQKNLTTFMASWVEDKNYYADAKLRKLYFKESSVQGESSYGEISDISKLTALELAEYYRDVLGNDQVDIIVMGDVSPTDVCKLFEKMPFTHRHISDFSLFYTEPLTENVDQQIEKEDLAQSKLNLGYHLPITIKDELYFALKVFNGLFGGFSHSKLFRNVREKESLAYYAHSSFDSFRSLLTVSTGIEGKNFTKVVNLINHQLKLLQKGNFSELEIKQTKEMLKNSYLLAQDAMSSQIEDIYLDKLVPESKWSNDQYWRLLNKVTSEEVAQVANSLNLQAIFFLKGEHDDK